MSALPGCPQRRRTREYRFALRALQVVFAAGGLPVLIVLTGCAQGGYIFRQGLGQIAIGLRSVPIAEALKDPALSPEEQEKLRMVIAARDFAHERLGLRVGRSYTLFHDTHGKPVSYNLSASRRDSLTPFQWKFPVIGVIDYIGYFDEADGKREQQRLEGMGYDTVLRGVDAYSTLGWFPDPLHSIMLRRDEGNLVETVIHELAHNTVYAPGQSTFNESLATFIGRKGAELFYRARGEAGEEMLARLRAGYEDNQRLSEWFSRLASELRALFGSDKSSAEKIAQREEIYEAARARFRREVLPSLKEPKRFERYATMPTNNAIVLLNERYNLDLDVMERAFSQCGGDFAKFLEQLRAVAHEPDPFAALRAIEAQSQPATRSAASAPGSR